MDEGTVISLCFSGAMLLGTFAKDIFGGANKLAAAFHALDKKTTQQVTELRLEFLGKIEARDNSARISHDTMVANLTELRLDFLQRIELRDNNAKIGFEAITANMHIIKEALLEQRAKMSEEFMRKESFYKATDDLKRDFKEQKEELKGDMKDGFDRVEKTLGEMAQAIELARKSRNSSHAA